MEFWNLLYYEKCGCFRYRMNRKFIKTGRAKVNHLVIATMDTFETISLASRDTISRVLGCVKICVEEILPSVQCKHYL